MFPAASLVMLLLTLSITASPVEVHKSPITIPIVRRHNSSSGRNDFLRHDKARVAALRTHGTHVFNAVDGIVPGLDDPGVEQLADNDLHYTALIEVGTPPLVGVFSPPPIFYNLIIDTGSSNTWVGAHKPYEVTSTSVDTGHPVAVAYSYGSFDGEEYLDAVNFGKGYVITQQSIGVAKKTVGFGSNIDGVLGIGPVKLTEGTLYNLSSTTTIPTVTNNLYSQGIISQDVVDIFFEPSSSQTESTGWLIFGGNDEAVYNGDIGYTSVTTTSPASNFWGINQSINYGSTTILSSTAGVVDTGSTFILIASDAYTIYQSATGGTPDKNTGCLVVSSAQYSALKNLDFNIGGETYSLTPNAQIWPRSLNSRIGGTEGVIYLIVNDIGTTSGQGLDFVNGFTFLQRFYAVFDTTNSRVGFGTTPFTDATTN